MDGESSYESDISESWSLIDINLNEELLPTASTELEKNSQSNLKKNKLRVINETEVDDYVKNCQQIYKTDHCQISDSDSDSSFKKEESPSISKTNLEELDSSSDRSLENDGKQDSGDAESIEILDIDSNYPDSEVERLNISQIDHFDFSTYQSDDEESLEGNCNEKRSNNSTVIRRRRLNKSSEEIVHCAPSDSSLGSLSENNLTVRSRDKDENNKLSRETGQTNAHAVYKHSRNNVANTVLSLSVGVIFAGVACIAIGHFLGVQDASETSAELAETLKKLQMENAALESHLYHLNRALSNSKTNQKPDLPLNHPREKVASEPTTFSPSNCDLNNAALSEIRSRLNSLEWLSELQGIGKKNKATDTEYGGKEFGKSTSKLPQDLTTGQEEGANISDDTNRKISYVLERIIRTLPSSLDHIENLNEKLFKLMNKFNHEIKKIFPETPGEIQSQLKKRIEDASETAVEWAKTLKKLHMEIDALESHLYHLNSVLLTQEVNDKLDLPLYRPQNEDSRDRIFPEDRSKRQEKNINNAEDPVTGSSFGSKWRSKLKNFFSRKLKLPSRKDDIDLKDFGKFLKDLLYSLNNRQGAGTKIIEDTHRKISNVVQKIISRLPTSQDHLDDLNEMLIKLKNKFNHKISKIFVQPIEQDIARRKSRVPVTELDLQSFNWNLKDETRKTPDLAYPESIVYYEFPKPESYYIAQNDFKKDGGDQLEVTNSSRVFNNEDSEEGEKVSKWNDKRRKVESKKTEGEKPLKNYWRKKKTPEKEMKEKKERKRVSNKVNKIVKHVGEAHKNKDKVVGPRNVKFNYNQNVFNDTVFQDKKYSKMKKTVGKAKGKSRKVGKAKSGKEFPSNSKKDFCLRKENYSPMCSGPEVFNGTGHWVFKWAGAREEIRRSQSLGDWQFERAKARKEMRDDFYHENWQFKRALARERNRDDFRRPRGKSTKHFEKEFFNEGFSWI